MPYNRLDIKLPDKPSEEKLHAALYQVSVGLDSFVDEIRVDNPHYNRPSLFIESLNLTKNK